MRLDLIWFKEFMSEWNGVSLIPQSSPSKTILVDASGCGIGGTDGCAAYGGQITPSDDPVLNISELGAANAVVTLHTLLSKDDRGAHIMLKTDNISSVFVFRTGKGRNRVMLESARALWMVQAVLDLRITYDHISGCDVLACTWVTIIENLLLTHV